MTKTADATVRAVNADPSSKVKLTYTFCDTKFSPTGSVACARQATDPKGCDGSPCDVVLDIVDLSDNLSIPTIARAGYGIVGENINTEQAQDNPNLFCMTGALKSVHEGIGYTLKKAGASKVGILGFTNPAAGNIQTWTESGLRAQGLSVSGADVIPVTTTDLSPGITKVLGGGADGLVFNGQNIGTAINVLNNAFKGTRLGLASYSIAPSFLQGTPASETNGISVSAWSQPPSEMRIPGVQRFRQEVGNAAGAQWRNYDNNLLNWLAIHFIAKVAGTVSGDIDKASMLKALKSADNVDMYGVLPPWSASQRGKGGAVPCSPFHIFVPETLKGGVQVADEPGVFRNPLTGKVVYVDPGFSKPTS